MVNSNSTCFCAALTQRKETKPFIWIACLTDYKSIPAQNEVLKGCGEFSFSMRGERESSVRCAHFPPRVPIFSNSHPGWVKAEVSPSFFLSLCLSLLFLSFSRSLSLPFLSPFPSVSQFLFLSLPFLFLPSALTSSFPFSQTMNISPEPPQYLWVLALRWSVR